MVIGLSGMFDESTDKHCQVEVQSMDDILEVVRRAQDAKQQNMLLPSEMKHIPGSHPPTM